MTTAWTIRQHGRHGFAAERRLEDGTWENSPTFRTKAEAEAWVAAR